MTTSAPDILPSAAAGLLEALRSGVAPFLGLPLQIEPTSARGVVLGVPFDGGVLHRAGARLGPWALRQASLGVGLRTMPARFQAEAAPTVFTAARGWVDGGNIPVPPLDLETALKATELQVAAWARLGARPLLLGGDHLLTLGALRALAGLHGPLGLVHIDAHPDAAGEGPWGGPKHHGSWLRLALEEGLVDPHRTVQIGLRAPRWDDAELQFLQGRGVRMWSPADLRDPRLSAQLKGDLNRAGQGPAYVTLDLDALDPSLCPAVAEPVPGGLAFHEVAAVLQHLHQWPAPAVGSDVMELAATLAGTEDSARVAVHLALHLLT
jgi:arginase family enzyme